MESSFVEFIGSGGSERSGWIKERVQQYAYKNGLTKVIDAMEQINEFVRLNDIRNYSDPELWRTDESRRCTKHNSYSLHISEDI